MPRNDILPNDRRLNVGDVFRFTEATQIRINGVLAYAAGGSTANEFLVTHTGYRGGAAGIPNGWHVTARMLSASGQFVNHPSLPTITFYQSGIIAGVIHSNPRPHRRMVQTVTWAEEK